MSLTSFLSVCTYFSSGVLPVLSVSILLPEKSKTGFRLTNGIWSTIHFESGPRLLSGRECVDSAIEFCCLSDLPSNLLIVRRVALFWVDCDVFMVLFSVYFGAHSNRAVQPIVCSPGSRMCSPSCKIVQYEMIIVGSFSGKSLKFLSPRCQMWKLKCTEFDFGWGSTLDPAGGDYSAPQTP